MLMRLSAALFDITTMPLLDADADAPLPYHLRYWYMIRRHMLIDATPLR